MHDLIDIERHKIIVEKAEDLLKYITEFDRDSVEEIVNSTKRILDNYNNKHLTVVNITNTEKGKWISFLKCVVFAKYFNHAFISRYPRHIGRWNNSKEDKVYLLMYFRQARKNKAKYGITRRNEAEKKGEINATIENTIYDDDLKHKYILLRRKYTYPKTTNLSAAITDSIRFEVLKSYHEQNQELINKYKKQ